MRNLSLIPERTKRLSSPKSSDGLFEVKWVLCKSGREANHPPPPTAEVKMRGTLSSMSTTSYLKNTFNLQHL
jgi:hypothetical protein